MTEGFRQAVAAMAALTADVQPRPRVYFEAIHSPHEGVHARLDGRLRARRRGRDQRGRRRRARARHQHRGLRQGAHPQPRIRDRRLPRAGRPHEPGHGRGDPGRERVPGAARAVRAGRVHLVDERLVSRPTLRLLTGIFEIGRILHPERFTDEARARLPLPQAVRP
ncbi:MAG: hypothetical protein MZV70_06540 [Desulfobacterales bacterium]|nr:hypothetical protein [Desulfobacterales bacterium]